MQITTGPMNPSSLLVNRLASKYQAPVVFVERLMDEETETIAAEARVKTFVPIFVTRRVEERLRTYAADHPEEAAAA
jgi:Protein of unknown function (DUF3562)